MPAVCTLGGPGWTNSSHWVDLILGGPIVNIGKPGVQRIAFKVYTHIRCTKMSQEIGPRHHHEKTSDHVELVENGGGRFFLEVAATAAP